jgi:hypothetical protein
VKPRLGWCLRAKLSCVAHVVLFGVHRRDQILIACTKLNTKC